MTGNPLACSVVLGKKITEKIIAITVDALVRESVIVVYVVGGHQAKGFLYKECFTLHLQQQKAYEPCACMRGLSSVKHGKRLDEESV